MKVSAKITNIDKSPQKVRLLANKLRNLGVVKAEEQLRFEEVGSKKAMQKLLQSAISNAVNNNGMVKDNLFIKEIFVNEGRVLKRWQPRAFGRAFPIRKKTSHIQITLDERIKGLKEKRTTKTAKNEDKKSFSNTTEKEKKVEPKAKRFGSKKQSEERGKGKSKKGLGGIGKKFFRRKNV